MKERLAWPSPLPGTCPPHPGEASVSTHNLEERGGRGQVRSSSQDCGLAHPQKPGLILQNLADAFLLRREAADRRRRKQMPGPQDTPGSVIPITLSVVPISFSPYMRARQEES